MDPWPFDQPRNAAAITLRRIVLPEPGATARPILYVHHYEADHSWFFGDGGNVRPADAAIVRMGTILRHDPTVAEVADLPPGWTASREAPGKSWVRLKNTPGRA